MAEQQFEQDVAWVVKHQPRTLDEMVLLPEHRAKFEKIINGAGLAKPILLYGDPGQGKTTVCEVIIRHISGINALIVNGSDATGVDDVRNLIAPYASKEPMPGMPLIVFIDEFDRMSPQAMDALKKIINETITNCAFLFATNHFNKIPSPIKSRCDKIALIPPNEASCKELKKEMFVKACSILKKEDVEFDKGVVQKHIVQRFPDYRETIMMLQECYDMYGEINENLLDMNRGVSDDLMKAMNSGDIPSIIEYTNIISTTGFYSDFYRNIKKYIKPDALAETIIILADYGHRHGVCADAQLNLASCLIELSAKKVFLKEIKR